MPPRTVALVAAVCVTIGWLLAAALTPPVARVQSLPDRQQRPAPAAEQAPVTTQLNVRLHTAPVEPTTGRNPFVFGARQPRPTPTRGVAPARPDAAPPAAERRSAGPSYSLSGIGVTGELRTAVLTDGENVHVVKVNDVVGAYTVVEITDSSATLASDTMRHTLRLAQ